MPETREGNRQDASKGCDDERERHAHAPKPDDGTPAKRGGGDHGRDRQWVALDDDGALARD